MSLLYGEQWALGMLLSFLFTWGIGLTPPLLIRFVFMRRPIGKGWAISVVALFWIFNIVFFTALGSESKTHFALILVAFVSYAILRKSTRVLITEQSSDSSLKAENTHYENAMTDLETNNIDNQLVNAVIKPEEEHSVSYGVIMDNTPDKPSKKSHFETAWREIEQEQINLGIWAEAFALCEGDETKTKAMYIKLRVAELLEIERREIDEQRQKKRKRDEEQRARIENRGSAADKKELQRINSLGHGEFITVGDFAASLMLSKAQVVKMLLHPLCDLVLGVHNLAV